MMYIVGDTVINYGVVKNVSYKKERECAFVKFEDDTVYEFKDKPERRRAQAVKKMMLRRGEKVLAIGAVSKSSDTYIYGFDIRRDGKVSQKGFSIIKGVVTLIKDGVIFVDCGGKESKVISKTNVAPGDFVIALCYSRSAVTCTTCKMKSSFSACQSCKNGDIENVAFHIYIEKEKVDG